MNEWNELYLEVILDHNKNPRNNGTLEQYTHHAEGHNPLCGDDITIQLIIKKNQVKEIKFKGEGCAISIASASLLTEEIKGKTIKEILKLNQEDIMKLLMIPISPGRIKCATLSLKAVQGAIK